MAIALALSALTGAQAQTGFGAMYVTTLPTGADVWVDGSYVGRTPVFLDGLRAGKHSVTLAKTGWKVQEIDQTIAPGVTSMASVQLDPMHERKGIGSIELHGVATLARVSIDNAPWGRVRTRYDEPAGMHVIRVRERAGQLTRQVNVYAGQITHVLFRAPIDETNAAAVVAPASDYLPDWSTHVSGGRIVIRYGSHLAVGRLGDARFVVDGKALVYNAPAGMVRGKLYLPLDLILTITGRTH